jgi:hypothetical protein
MPWRNRCTIPPYQSDLSVQRRRETLPYMLHVTCSVFSACINTFSRQQYVNHWRMIRCWRVDLSGRVDFNFSSVVSTGQCSMHVVAWMIFKNLAWFLLLRIRKQKLTFSSCHECPLQGNLCVCFCEIKFLRTFLPQYYFVISSTFIQHP